MKKLLCCLLAVVLLSGCAASERMANGSFEAEGSKISVSSGSASSEPGKELSQDDKTVIRYLEEAMSGTLLVTVSQSGLAEETLFFAGKSYRSARFTANGRFMFCQNGTVYEGETAPKVYSTVDLWTGREYFPQDEPVSWSETVLLSDNLIGCADGHMFDQSNPNRTALRLYNIFFETQEVFLQIDYGQTVAMDYFPYEIPENGPLSIGYHPEAEEYIVSYAVDRGEWVPGMESYPAVYINNRIGVAVFDKTGKEISSVLLPEKYYANYVSHQESICGLYDSPLTVLPDGNVLMQAYYAGEVSAHPDLPPAVHSCVLLVNPQTGAAQEIPYSWYDGERLVTSPDGKYLYAMKWGASGMPKVIVKIENGRAAVDERLTGSLQTWRENNGKDVQKVLFGEDNRLYFTAKGKDDFYPSLYRLANDTGGALRLCPLPPWEQYSLIDADEDGNVRLLVVGATGADRQEYEDWIEKIGGTEDS